jgi:hypothetical protein
VKPPSKEINPYGPPRFMPGGPAFCLDVQDVQQVRMRGHGCFPATILAQPRRPCRPRHPYAVPRTSLRCVYTRRRNCIEQLPPFPKYAPGIDPMPAHKSASCGCGDQPALELAGQTRTSGLRRVMQGVISRRPLVREICIDRVSYKNASAKQTHD